VKESRNIGTIPLDEALQICADVRVELPEGCSPARAGSTRAVWNSPEASERRRVAVSRAAAWCGRVLSGML